MIDEAWVLSELRRTLANLASCPERQLETLRASGDVSNDELALDFDAIAPVAPALERMGKLTREQVRAIAILSEYLDSISGERNAALWTDEGIKTAHEWAHVRELAVKALASLG